MDAIADLVCSGSIKESSMLINKHLGKILKYWLRMITKRTNQKVYLSLNIIAQIAELETNLLFYYAYSNRWVVVLTLLIF